MTTYNDDNMQERMTKRDDNARHQRKTMTQCMTMTHRDDIHYKDVA